jgi:2,3-bisphosphoglycerate-dependent phosphoglycerate mutase
MEPGGEHDFSQDPRYKGRDIPNTESLKTTLERVLPYWENAIAPRLRAGRPILIAAHGNSLRAIVKHLFNVGDDQITAVEIPTGNPLLIGLDENLRPVSARYLDEARAQALPPIP